jgi:hypothetical protein
MPNPFIHHTMQDAPLEWGAEVAVYVTASQLADSLVENAPVIILRVSRLLCASFVVLIVCRSHVSRIAINGAS